jgi:dimethylamine corrinoid protein
MANRSWKEQLIHQMSNLQIKEVLAYVKDLLEEGQHPLTIIEVCKEGMRIVGQRYEQRQYYLAGLVMAGETFHQVLMLIQPFLSSISPNENSGRVLIGTVRGDIHDMGKNLFEALLRCHGFEVHDLGVDVPTEEFLRRTESVQPDVVGLSGLLTTSYDAMRESIEQLHSLPEKSRPKAVIIGGGLLNEQVCQYVGADFWTIDAMEGVKFCQQVVQQNL